MPHNKFIINHFKEHHHRFHFFFVLILAVSISFGIYVGLFAQAQTSTQPPPGPTSVFDTFNLWAVPKILSGLACYFVKFGLITVGLAVILSGILLLISRGNPQAFTEAKKTLLYVIIGGLVIYGVYTIILSVASIWGVTSLPWIPLTCP